MSKKQCYNDTDTGKEKWLEKSLLHYHFVHHTFPVDWPAQNWTSMTKGWWLSMLANLVYRTQHCSKHIQHCTNAHIIYRKLRKGKNITGIIIRITPICFSWVLKNTICPFS
jgi:hypothetical protein